MPLRISGLSNACNVEWAGIHLIVHTMDFGESAALKYGKLYLRLQSEPLVL